MKKFKIMSVFGTRPEAIKMAPLVKELAVRDCFESICCLTGQHRQMLDSVMEIFHLRGDYDLDIMEKSQTLSTITTKTLLGMDHVIDEAQPDMILVHGDTSTTFAGALAAFYHKIPVGHVEAGLRTWDKYSPFPEEMNRTLVGDIATLHFSPTRANAENLRREAIAGEIFITGNTAIAAGTAKLAGVETERIVSMANTLLDDPTAYEKMAKAVNPYGDGNACSRIADAIAWHFGVQPQRPADFSAE